MMASAALQTQPAGSSAEHTWKPLKLLNYYRIALAALFTAAFSMGLGPSILGKYHPHLFEATALAYLVFGLAGTALIRWQRSGFVVLTTAQMLADIVAITLLMHASGGLISGLGILLVVSIAGGSIIMAGRLATLYAALAALAILGEQVYAQWEGQFETTAYTQAGLLGVALFATAALGHVLARRIRETEALAAKRGVDLANLEQLNDYIIRHLQSGILVVDAEDRVRMLNQAARYLLGAPQTRTGTSLARIAPQLAQEVAAWRTDPRHEAASIQTRDEAPTTLPRFMRLGTGEDAATLVLLEDAADVNQQMQQLKLASLGRLTASIAHEIRNPLGAISHAAQLLGESDQAAGDRRLVEIISDHTRRMNTIIENVLQLSRRDAAHARAFDLAPWLHGFADEFRTVQGLQPEQLTVEVEPADIQVYIDPTHLQQVLWNLCQNALQHAEPVDGAVQLTLTGRRGLDGHGTSLEIIDNGAGIDPDAAQQIFEPFYTTAAGGTGLGLYIARELCEFNRARLSYVPDATGGGRFRISFKDAASMHT